MSKRHLYFGLRCPDPSYVHCPLIEIRARDLPPAALVQTCSHGIFTSCTTVDLLASKLELRHLHCLAVGPATARALEKLEVQNIICAEPHTAEGICTLLEGLPKGVRVFYPHSAISRPVIRNCLQRLDIPYEPWPLYDTVTATVSALPDLADFDVLHFSSPSTVRAFHELYGDFPAHCELRAIGPITEQALSPDGNQNEKSAPLRL